MKSIVGSSCIRPDASGLAPIRSPALTTKVFSASEPSAFRCVAKYSAPPAGTAVPVAGLTIVPGVPASRWPWKSLNASSRSFVCAGGFGFFGPLASPTGAMASASAATASKNTVLLM